MPERKHHPAGAEQTSFGSGDLAFEMLDSPDPESSTLQLRGTAKRAKRTREMVDLDFLTTVHERMVAARFWLQAAETMLATLPDDKWQPESDPRIERIRDGLTIAAITTFFSCFPRRGRHANLAGLIRDSDSVHQKTWYESKKLRDKAVAHLDPSNSDHLLKHKHYVLFSEDHDGPIGYQWFQEGNLFKFTTQQRQEFIGLVEHAIAFIDSRIKKLYEHLADSERKKRR